MGSGQGNLLDLRQQIDSIDSDLVKLLNRRASLVQAVGELKKKSNSAVFDPSREKEILIKIQSQNQGPLPSPLLEKIFIELIQNFRNWEESLKNPIKAKLLKGKTISVIGLGLLGTSIVKRIKFIDPDLKIIGFDKNQSTNLSLADALKADLVILAVPVLAIMEIIKENAGNFQSGAVILDLGSTKLQIVETAEKFLDKTVSFIGGHPLAGKSQSGSEFGEKDLFVGRPFVVTPSILGKAEAHQMVEELIQILGGTQILMSASAHDQMTALTSHLPQIISTNLSALSEDVSLGFEQDLVYGPAFKEMTRLADSDFKMWHDIAVTNSQNILEMLTNFIQRLSDFKKTIAEGTFEKDFEIAKLFKQTKVE